MSRSVQVSIFLLLALCLVFPVDAFTTIAPVALQPTASQFSSTAIPAFDPSSSMDIAVETLDPTTILTDVLSGLLGSPAILLVPVGAAVLVASTIAFFILSYANPAVDDDEI